MLRVRAVGWLRFLTSNSKEAFHKRVRQLEKELARIKTFHVEPAKFHLYLFDKATRITGVVLAAIAMFMIAFGISASPIGGTGFELMLVLTPVAAIITTIGVLIDLNKLIMMVGRPERFGVEVVKFMVDAKNKGFELNEDSELLRFLGQVKRDAIAKRKGITIKEG